MGSYTIEMLVGWVTNAASRVETVGGQLLQDRAQLHQSERRVISLQTELERQRSSAASLRTQIASMEAQTGDGDENNENSAGLKTQISRAKGELAQLESAMNASGGAITQAQAIIRQCRQQIGVHTAKLQEMDRGIGEIHEHLEEKYAEKACAAAQFCRAGSSRFGGSAAVAASRMQSAMDDCRKAQSQAEAIRERIRQLLDGAGQSGAANRDPTLPPEDLKQLLEMERSGEIDDYDEASLDRVHCRLSGKLLSEEPIVIDMPYRMDASYSAESFIRQALEHEETLNGLTVESFLQNYRSRRANGRSAAGTKAQRQYAEGIREKIINDRGERDSSLTQAQLEAIAEQEMKSGAALHGVDQIAGGSPTEIYSYGSGAVNSALGSLWGHRRARQLYQQVLKLSEGMSQEDMRSTYLNVRLNIHPKE